MQVLAVPVKSLRRAKSRLASVLSPRERAALMLAMVDDVLDACLAVPDWETWLISPDEQVRSRAAARGARPVVERGTTLTGAVRQVEAALAGSADALAVVLADLPYVTSDDLEAALSVDASVVAAPAASDGGTNLLVRRPPSAIPATFGRSSFAKHQTAARRSGHLLTAVGTVGLRRDLDRPSDLAELLASGHHGRARSACIAMGVAPRLMAVPAGSEG